MFVCLFFFFSLHYLLHTHCPISIPTPFFFLFLPHSSLKNVLALTFSIFFSLARSLCFFFLLDSRTVVPNVVQMGHLRPKAVGLAGSIAHLRLQCSPDGSDGFCLLSFVFFFFFFFFFSFIFIILLILELCF